jgi:glycine cleavage system H protein
LGDVVDVTLPAADESVTAHEPLGEVESTKSVGDLVAPVTGSVRTRNDVLRNDPSAINTDPYGEGWQLEVGLDPDTRDAQLSPLMDATAYGNWWVSHELRDPSHHPTGQRRRPGAHFLH